MTTMTSVQKILYGVMILNGLGQKAEVDQTNPPVAASSDETVVRVTEPRQTADGGWEFEAIAVLPGSARVTFTADADVGENVSNVVGVDEIEVTADPRLAERTVSLVAGTPVDNLPA